MLGGSLACSTEPPTSDSPPPALDLGLVAADPGTVLAGQRVSLGALPSGGAGGRSMGWTQVQGPEVSLDDPASIHPSLWAPAVDEVTTLAFEVSVVDRTGQRATRSVSLVVEPAPLTVSAGAEQRVAPGQTVALNGVLAGSADVAEVTWTQTLGTPVSLDDVHRLDPTFVAPTPDAGAELAFSLEATTSAGAVVAGHTSIRIAEDWFGVHAGPDLTATAGDDLSLRATPRGELTPPLTWSWSWSSPGGDASITQAATPATTATLGSGDNWAFMVTVEDVDGRTAQDELSVIGITPPGADLWVNTISAVQFIPGVPARLHATAAGGDGSFTYAWQDLSGVLSLSDADTPDPLVTAPAVANLIDALLLVEVTDGTGATATDLASFSVVSASGTLQAGADRTVGGGQRVYLTATLDQGAPVGPVTWTKQSGPTFPVEGLETRNPNFVAPQLDTTLVFAVEGAGVLADDIRLSVDADDPEPRMFAPAEVVSGQRFSVTAALDQPPTQGAVTFTWQQVDGPAAVLGSGDTATLEVTAPVVDDDDAITLGVVVELSSGRKAVATTSIEVAGRATVRPPAALPAASIGIDDRRMLTCEASVRCDLDQSLTTCPPERPFGLNHVRMPGDGTYEIRKRCASAETCYARWWATTRVDADCSALRAPGTDLTGLAEGGTIRICELCCSGAECNAPTFPDDDTLLRCDADGCRPRR